MAGEKVTPGIEEKSIIEDRENDCSRESRQGVSFWGLEGRAVVRRQHLYYLY